VIKNGWTDLLRDVKLSGDLFLSGELHDEVLVTSLSLADRLAQTQLEGASESASHEDI
jgi:hypothetical protein